MYATGKLEQLLTSWTSKKEHVTLGNLRSAAHSAGLKFVDASKGHLTYDIVDHEGGVVRFGRSSKVYWTYNVNAEEGFVVFVPHLLYESTRNDWNISLVLLAALGYEPVKITLEEKVVTLPIPVWVYPEGQDYTAMAWNHSLVMYESDAKVMASEFIAQLEKFL